MRSSRSAADTSTPVRCGLVSSREADLATRPIVSTNAAAGTRMILASPIAGSFGNSSAGRVRRWKREGPDTTSTSPSDERYSSERPSFGSERPTSRRRRRESAEEGAAGDHGGALARDGGLGRDADAQLHVGGLQLPAVGARLKPD